MFVLKNNIKKELNQALRPLARSVLRVLLAFYLKDHRDECDFLPYFVTYLPDLVSSKGPITLSLSDFPLEYLRKIALLSN